MIRNKKLSTKQTPKHACTKDANVSVTVVGWCCSFYQTALEKRLLNLGLEMKEAIDYQLEPDFGNGLGPNDKVLLLAGLSAFSPQLITTKLYDVVAKIPARTHVVFAGHKSLHETISNLLINVVCCPPLFSDSYEIVNFEFEKHIVNFSENVVNIALNAGKISNVPSDYHNIFISALVVAEHTNSCSLLTRDETWGDQWQIQRVIGFNLFIEKFQAVYSSDLRLIKKIAEIQLDGFHEILTSGLLSLSSKRELEIIYLTFITNLLVNKVKTDGNRNKICIVFAGSISQNFSFEDLENIIEIVFESDNLMLLKSEINGDEILRKMER